ncbi:MAG: glycosyltransferase family A protein [Candidatus Paceibacterota bacterium]|jgi:glycosyltransferase involved in cell wall biosynthesis|nr:glycosyltransferase family 2 protein [Candidatus Paceibacterota bacterium]
MENPKVSLIICAYNEEKYIGECLDRAIKSSGGKFFEILVIDNASTDRTKETAEMRAGVRVIREEKKGLTRARQRGFEESKGDILAYIDSDTHMPAGWLDTVMREFERDEKLAVLSGPYVYYDISKWQQFLVKLYWYVLAVPIYWIVGYMTVGGNFAIKKDVLKKMNGFDTTIEFYGEDTNIARRAHQFGYVKFKPNFIMYTSGRRLTGQGVCSTTTAYMLNYISEAFFHKPATKEYTDIR